MTKGPSPSELSALAKELVQPLAKQALTQQTAMSIFRIVTKGTKSAGTMVGFEGYEADIVLEELKALLEESTRAESNKPDGYLLAARWLLAMGRDRDPSKFDLTAALRDTGLQKLPLNMASKVSLEKQLEDGKRGIHSHVAFFCLKRTAAWSRESPKWTHNGFDQGMESPRARDVARVMALAIRARYVRLKTDPEFFANRKAIWTRLQEPPVPAPAARPLPPFFYELADRIDQPTEGYPERLKPSWLAKSLTLSPLGKQDPSERAEDLYSSYSSRGGRPADEVVRGWRLVVLGNPGGGKSTVLAATVADRIRNHHAPAILVRLSTLAARVDDIQTFESLLTLIVKIVNEEHGLSISDNDLRHIVRPLATAPNALLALDGLDEVMPEHRPRAIRMITTLTRHPGPVMISSRLTGYAKPAHDWNETHVDELSPQSAQGFIEEWFRDGNLAGLKRASNALSSPNHAGLSTVPVLVGIVASVAEANEVPETRAELYRAYVEQFLQQKWKAPDQQPQLHEIPPRYDIAKEVAMAMATGEGGQLDGANWTDTIVYRHLIDATTTSDPGLARRLAENHGLLTAQSSPGTAMSPKFPTMGQKYRWLHRTVHEHLVGAALADRVRASRDDLGGLDAILLGPKQWDAPLRHLIGLLSEADRSLLFKRVDKLAVIGDPGRVLETVRDSLAEALPAGDAYRKELARARFAEGQPYSALLLDEGYLRSQLAGALRRKDKAVLRWGIGLLPDRLDLSEKEVRELIAAQPAGEGRSVALYSEALARLSAHDPDDALRLLVEAARTNDVELPWDRWRMPPSADAVRSAADQVAGWEAWKRIPLLAFLSHTGGDLSPSEQPDGPLPASDVGAAREYLLRVRPLFDAEAAPSRAHLEPLRAFWRGDYGAELAYIAAGLVGDLPEDASASEGAQLQQAVARLRAAQPERDFGADEPTRAMQSLRRMSSETIRHVDTLTEFVSAATRCVENASGVPIEWAVSMQARVQPDATRRAPRGLGLHQLGAVEAISDSLLKILLARPDETKRVVLEDHPNVWPGERGVGHDFAVLAALNNAGLLSPGDTAAFIGWAAKKGTSVLWSVPLGADAESVLQIVDATCSDAFAVDRSRFSVQLAELGLLHRWRTRILEATTDLDPGWIRK